MRHFLLFLATIFCAVGPSHAGPAWLAQDAAPSAPVLAFESRSSVDAASAGAELRLALLVTVPEGWHINAHKPLDEYLIPTKLIIDAAKGVEVKEIAYPDPVVKRFPFSEEPMAVYEGRFVIGVVVRLAEGMASGPRALKGQLAYQSCNDTQCQAPTKADVALEFVVASKDAAATAQNQDIFAAISFGQKTAAGVESHSTPVPPEAPATSAREGDWLSAASDFSVLDRSSGYMTASAFLSWLDDMEAGRPTQGLNRFAGKSLWLVFVLTLLGGLALNLTPCVLPLIPVNLAIIGAGAQGGSRSRGFLLGVFYGLGITMSYGALGLAAALAGTVFGAINASPWFNLAIALIFVALALALLEVFVIDFSRFQTKLGMKKRPKGSLLVALVMGAISALLAGACVSPVVISVILLSQDLYAKGSPAGLLLPFVLGAGMALPWPFAGAGLGLLPKPGAWMRRVNYTFAVIILGFSVYYGHLAYNQFAQRYGADPDAVKTSVQAMDQDGWTPNLAQGLDQAHREGKPVFIDFWASWCKNCLTMNVTTFKDPEVKRRLGSYIKVKYQAETPDSSPARDVMTHFGVGGLGLPVYVVLHPHN